MGPIKETKKTKKVKKIFNKTDKLKAKIKELELLLLEAQKDKDYLQGRYDGLESKLVELEKVSSKVFSTIEGKEIPTFEERNWLRNLVELIVVDASKFEKIAEIRGKRNEPFNNGRCY